MDGDDDEAALETDCEADEVYIQEQKRFIRKYRKRERLEGLVLFLIYYINRRLGSHYRLELAFGERT